MDNFESKIKHLNSRLDTLQKINDSRYKKIDESLAKTEKISNLETLTSKINDLNQKIEPINKSLDQLELKYEKIKKIEQVVFKSGSEIDFVEAYKRLKDL